MSSFLEAMLSDPTGGHRELQDPTISTTALLLDIGLGLYGEDIVEGSKKFLRRRVKRQAQYLRKAYLNLFQNMKMPHPYLSNRYVLRQQVSAPISYLKQTTKVINSIPATSLARMARGLAITGLFTWGLTMAAEFASPGIQRAERRKEQEPLQDQVFIDTRAAYTQRQRALQAIHDSQLSVSRAILGQEARYVHR